jgi:anaerobic magnesium-protoporphyrin IX monomethyl ester cyclase
MRETTLFSATLGEDKKIEPPLGPLYIASALEGAGWKVDFRDYQLCEGANAFDPGLIVKYLGGHCQVLMISCFVDMLPVVIAAAETIKFDRPDTYILLGGPGPSAGAAELLSNFPAIDAIVVGEGEETISEWARAYECGLRPIAGAVCRIDGTIIEGGPRQRLAELKAMRPAYHLLDWSLYSAGRIITTRGCPYRCSFCDVAPLWGRKAVYRDLISTTEEMVLLKSKYGRRGIAIADDTFVLDRERVRAFCQLLLKQDIRMEWGCFGRINLMSEELIALMAEAGCRSIFYGIDSGSPAILKRTYKELSYESIVPVLELSARYFQFIEASFIWGYPYESLDDFELTFKLAAEASRFAPKVNVQLHMLSPLPSSPVYKEFAGDLLNPEKEDVRWLLLPGVLLDDRATIVRSIISKAPALFPGFFSFPTPAKSAKRAMLEQVLRAMEATLGRMLLDDRVFGLIREENRAIEAELLDQAKGHSERIGVGLALGVFRRTRLNQGRPVTPAWQGSRSASLVRQRNDAPELRVI